jgi:hypothetical protein
VEVLAEELPELLFDRVGFDPWTAEPEEAVG